MGQTFVIGQIVRLIADPTRTGSIISILPPVGGQPRYRVFHSPSDQRVYQANQLEPDNTIVFEDELINALLNQNWVSPDQFLARLTAERLARPQVDHLYSLYAGRIQHIPFQFKPLLRFLRADQPRLFIADEVGVGKTIEAGLILKELQARQRIDNVMILCPKALVNKWRDEMRRFDEDFRPLSAENLRYCLDETHYDGIWPAQYSRVIVHLELLRQENYLNGISSRTYPKPGLMSLEPPPHFNLLIVDEAHHLRNTGTLSYKLARLLCEISDAVLFLSATPVHVGSENLFNLLNLLRPDLFTDINVFNQIIEPNQYLTHAMRHVRTRRPQESWQADAALTIEEAGRTAWGAQVISRDPLFRQWKVRLNAEEPLTDAERVHCLRDLEELHSLAHIVNRTRRRDIGRFTIREPHTVLIPFTAEQKLFYETLLDFRRNMLLEVHDSLVVNLMMDTLQRQAASCLPALIPLLNGFIRTGRFSPEVMTDDPDVEEFSNGFSAGVMSDVEELRSLAQSLPNEDPKFDQLLALIQDTLRGEGPGKVLIFSYFLHTLHYLRKRLYLIGYRVAIVTGQVSDEERELLRNRFRLPRDNEDAIDILLSSEVGCEGLDYEFCDRLVNYDIPWNPMKIEQRIGRIDRFGQKAEKILIFNFVTPGTVEERIYYRCFERLGIFRDTLGDLEEVLGELLENLSRIALDPGLTAEQAEEKARQTSDNYLLRIEEERRLEEESGTLLGVDQDFTEEVRSLISKGKFVSPDDLRHMVALFVEQPEIGGKLLHEEKSRALDKLRLRKESRNALLEKIQEAERVDRATLAFIHWLQGDDAYLSLTFDQQTALENRSLPFITPVHPLSRAAIDYWVKQKEPLALCIKTTDKESMSGRYLFICELWDFIGIHSETRLETVTWDLDHDCLDNQLSERVFEIIRQTGIHALPDLEKDIPENAITKMEGMIEVRRLETLRQYRERNDFVISRRIASLNTWYQTRSNQINSEIALIRDEKIKRMKVSERERHTRNHQQKLHELDSKKVADITTKRVAVGILEVTHGQ